MTPKTNKYIPISPHPKQAAFLLLSCRDAFFGGAAGGGKSEALLTAALQYVDEPGYAAIILRRSFRDLNQPEAIMNRAYSWLYPYRKTGEIHWNGNDKRWTFPGGSTLTFGYMDRIGDEYGYQGAEFQFVGFDELTQFQEPQVLYLFSRLRRKAGVRVPLRMRTASNPGGVGHEWVKQRYIVEGRQKGRIFIPSRIADNPSLDQKEYLESLSELDSVTRQQLLAGDWDVNYDGGLFKRDWFKGKFLEATPDLSFSRIVRHWDLAASERTQTNTDPDWTVGLKMAALREGNKKVVLDVVRVRRTPGDVERIVRATAEADGKHVEIVIEQEPGSSGVNVIHNYITNVLQGFYVKGYRPSGDKFTRAKPLSAQVEHGNVLVMRALWTTDFINEVVWFDGSGKGHDDQVDAFSGAYEDLIGGSATVMRTGGLAAPR